MSDKSEYMNGIYKLLCFFDRFGYNILQIHQNNQNIVATTIIKNLKLPNIHTYIFKYTSETRLKHGKLKLSDI